MEKAAECDESAGANVTNYGPPFVSPPTAFSFNAHANAAPHGSGLESQWRDEPEKADSIGCEMARLLVSLLLCPALGLAAIVSLLASANVSFRPSGSRSKVAPPTTADGHDAEFVAKAAAKRASLQSVSSDLALFGIIYGALNLAIVGIVFGLTAWKGTLGYD